MNDRLGPLVSHDLYRSALYISLNGTNEARYLLKTGEALSESMEDENCRGAVSVELYEHTKLFLTDDYTQKMYFFS